MEVLAISIGRNILREGSRDRLRMESYAEKLDAYHIVVLTLHKHGFTDEVHDKSLHLYPTNSRWRVTMLINAFMIGARILRGAEKKRCTITAQDPFLIGWFSWVLSKIGGGILHVQIHGDYYSSDAWAGYSILRRIQRYIGLLLIRKAPKIRVVSERIKLSLVKRGIDSEKITVLPIRPELETFLEVDHRYKMNPPYTLLFIGRLAPEKNIDRIIDSFADVYDTHQDITLKIVGEGSEYARLIAYVKKLRLDHVITFSPWTEDVRSEMNSADIFLVASLHEAYGLTLIEAMAVGLPIVTTDVGCVGEVLKHEKHGIVVYENGIDAYAQALRNMLDNPMCMEQYGRAGKRTASQIAAHSKEKYISDWVTALSE